MQTLIINIFKAHFNSRSRETSVHRAYCLLKYQVVTV
jgi:hypothetical protein